MRASVWVMGWVAIGAVIAGAGCVPRYRQPNLDEPHAVVRIRLVRHDWTGPMLSETVRLNGHDIPVTRAGPQPTIVPVRVRPEETRWRFETLFYHMEQRPHLETYQESYSCGGYTSSYGGRSTYQSRTCYRTRTRMVYRNVQVPDGRCAMGVFHLPREGAAYLVQYEYFGHGRCTARCYRQVPLPGGQFQLAECGPLEPPGENALPGESAPHAAPPAVPPQTTTSGGAATPATRLGAP